MRRTARIAASAVVCLVLATAAACSGDDGDEEDPDASESSSQSSVDPSRVSPADLPEAPPIAEAEGAVNDASFGDCATGEGDQTVTGTVTNPLADERDYVIVVSWVNETSDVLARGVATLTDLEGGASADFEVSASVPSGIADCTFLVQRGDLG